MAEGAFRRRVRGELIVYGYLPMMVSAQCVKKTMEGCTGRPEVLYLRDRKGKAFPVKNQCRFCFNTIYNESPLSLLGLSGEAASCRRRHTGSSYAGGQRDGKKGAPLLL